VDIFAAADVLKAPIISRSFVEKYVEAKSDNHRGRGPVRELV